MTVTEAPSVQDILQSGAAKHRMGDLVGAAEEYNRVLLIEPEHAYAMHLVGLLAVQRGYPEMALDWVGRALAIKPDMAPAHGTLGLVLAARGNRVGAYAEFRRSVALDPGLRESWDNVIFSADLDPHTTRAEALELRRQYDERFILPLLKRAAPHTNSRTPGRKLRVGYVSGDFRMHSAGFASWPIISRHDHERFEIHLFDNGQKPDPLSQRFHQAADYFHIIAGMEDEQVAELIRQHEIDVLVDLSGFSGRNRLPVFARRPAPVQITALGYLADTMGLSCFDGIVVDNVVCPAGATGFTEQPLRIPAFLPYEPLIEMPEVGPPPVERNGYPTFGYLGRPNKLNDAVLSTWATIMKRVSTSRLLLKAAVYDDEECAMSIVDQLVALGIDDERIEVRGGSTPYDHAAAYGDVDIALDSFPQNGAITTLEAAYMGVPTVTFSGERVQERFGETVMRAVLLSTARSVRDYADYAVLRAEKASGSIARGSLRNSLQRSPFMQHERLTRALEGHYVEMFERWSAS